jgi:histidyl-tRNA synthetase
VGTASDFFVKKEMYTIEEEDEASITLRPEFTAGFVRAYIENGLFNQTQPVKLYTIGPVFRRERPQAGRFRQHSQFNVEVLGETDPAADVEVMLIAMDLYRSLGFKGLEFQLNSTGCPECKPAYVEKLKEYLAQHEERLADVDKERIKRNALRVLDSKEPGMDELLADAPHIADHLCADCDDHFAQLRHTLDDLDQPYTSISGWCAALIITPRRCLRCGPKGLGRRRPFVAAAVTMGWPKRLAVRRRPALALAAASSVSFWP